MLAFESTVFMSTAIDPYEEQLSSTVEGNYLLLNYTKLKTRPDIIRKLAEQADYRKIFYDIYLLIFKTDATIAPIIDPIFVSGLTYNASAVSIFFNTAPGRDLWKSQFKPDFTPAINKIIQYPKIADNLLSSEDSILSVLYYPVDFNKLITEEEAKTKTIETEAAKKIAEETAIKQITEESARKVQTAEAARKIAEAETARVINEEMIRRRETTSVRQKEMELLLSQRTEMLKMDTLERAIKVHTTAATVVAPPIEQLPARFTPQQYVQAKAIMGVNIEEYTPYIITGVVVLLVFMIIK